MADVTVRMTAEDASMVAAWKRARDAQSAFEAQLRSTKNQAGGTEAAITQMLSNGAAGVGRFVVAFTGIGSVIAGVLALVNQIKREYENLLAKQRGARDAQLGIAEAQREAVMVLDGKSATPQFLQSEVQRISKSTGADQAAVYNAIAGALGSRPPEVSEKELISKAAEIAARVSPTNPNDMALNLRAMMSQKAATGGSFEDIAGYQIRMKRLSPTKDMQSFAGNIAPAIGRGMGLGVSPDEQAGLLVHFGNKMGDFEGMVTASAVTNFEKNLISLTKGKVEGGVTDRLKFLQTKEGSKIKDKLLGPFRKDAEAAEGGVSGITGEARAFSTMLGLVDGTDLPALENAITAVGTTEGSASTYRETMANVEAMPLQQTAKADRQSKATTQAIQTSDLGGAKAAISRDRLMEILKASGSWDVTQRLAWARFELNTSLGNEAPVDEFANQLLEKADNLDRPTKTGRYTPQPVFTDYGKLGKVRTGTRMVDVMQPAPAEDRATAAQLRELVSELRNIFRDSLKDVKITPVVNVVTDSERPKPVASEALGRPTR